MGKRTVAFSIAGASMTLLFLIITNHLTSPYYAWSIYPIFAIVYWPICTYCISKKQYKLLSIIGALITIVFFATINYTTSPIHPWFLYTALPILWWPIIQYSGKWAKTFSFSVISSCIFIVYYIFLNYLISPSYPWSIYTTFTFIWWPIAVYFVKNRKPFILAIISTLLISTFFILVNLISSPSNIWAVYPIFMILWWPLVIYYFKVRKV